MEAYKKDKEFMELVGHLIQHPRFQKLGNIPQHHYSTRMEHSINVAYTSYKIAKKLVGMKNPRREEDFYTISFITIGEKPSLIRVMRGYIQELPFETLEN